ncbi:hypothetical protein AAFN60_18955 [Roseibacillus persicicus]|uniref:hypothetical protein n=1 Tax=Roseibacillus persicicus TaxID=454148 RepID=UPI00398B3401
MREHESFEAEPGTPTLTVIEDGKETMIPWHGFVSGCHQAGTIQLSFQNWILELEGENLEMIWEKLKLQDVLTIRRSVQVEQNDGEVWLSLVRLSPLADD